MNKNKQAAESLIHKNVPALIITAIVAVMAVACLLTLNTDNAAARVTYAPAPVGINNAHLKWERQFGTGYANAVTPPLVIGDSICVGSGGVMYKLDRNTGAIKDKCSLKGVFGYTTIAPSHNGSRADGSDATAIYVPVSEGRIGAVDISGAKMKLLEGWQNGASESFGGQAISPVVYHNGYLYTGAYGDKTGSNYFVEIDAANGKIKTRLATNGNGGYYWCGAYATDEFAVFGEESANGISTVKCVATSGNKTNAAGTLISQQQVNGTVRGSMVPRMEGDATYLYFVSQSKLLYKMQINNDGTLETPQSVKLSGQSVGVPQITESRAYVGTSASKVDVIDIRSGETSGMSLKYSVSVPGYPQGEMLVIRKDSQADYVYGTYNKKPGGMFFIEAGSEGAVASGNLYTPVHPQYCISPVECDENGTLYFKNDSGYIMAVEDGYDLKAPVLKKSSVSASKTDIAWSRNNGADIYNVFRKNGSGVYRMIGTVSGGAYTDRKTLPGIRYTYKVRGRIGSLQTEYSNEITAVSALGKPKITTKAGKKKLLVKWKAVTGASGYQVYQAKKKKGKYKCVCTVRKPGATSFVKKKLKSKKKYYYKVRAFRTIGEKTVYSGFSNISYKKVK